MHFLILPKATRSIICVGGAGLFVAERSHDSDDPEPVVLFGIVRAIWCTTLQTIKVGGCTYSLVVCAYLMKTMKKNKSCQCHQ